VAASDAVLDDQPVEEVQEPVSEQTPEAVAALATVDEE
jgi:hypothetical protein